jgi:hypothetical protein
MDRQDLGDGPITDVGVLAGGTQNILLRFTRSDRQYVLRMPPLSKRPNSAIPCAARRACSGHSTPRRYPTRP